jgi:hypothetical protein
VLAAMLTADKGDERLEDRAAPSVKPQTVTIAERLLISFFKISQKTTLNVNVFTDGRAVATTQSWRPYQMNGGKK